MKRAIGWLLVIAMTAVIAVGGTMAYLTDTDEDVNVMTVGRVRIDQLEYERVDTETKDDDAIVQEFHDNKPLYPAVTDPGFNWKTDPTVDWTQIGKDGYTSNIWDPEKINNELDKMVFVKNKGDFDAYVRSVFAFEANGYTLDEFKELFHLNINETDWTWEWVETPVAIPGEDGVTTNYIIATATYNKVLKPGELTEISLSQIALDPAAGNADIAGLGDTYQVLVKSQAVQTEGFAGADEALNEAFGEITAVNVPFETDSPIRGIDLKTALHYYEGDQSAQITTSVSNVIFALNKEHPEILDDYDGTLVDVEQKVDVYAYYVPNAGKYDVYVLANETIFAPQDSSYLFSGMTSLVSVDTHNLDVSHAQTMRRMFGGCTALAEVDVSHFDTASVTSMDGMFFNCRKIETLDVSKWDIGNVTNMYAMFYNCKTLPSLDVRDWDVSNVTNMAFTFCGCDRFTTLDVSQWDVHNVTTFNAFFQSAEKTYVNMQLETIDVSKWDVSGCKNMDRMFYGCGKLRSLDMSGWNTENVAIVESMFFNCKELTTLYVSDQWSTANMTKTDGMLIGCDKLVGGNGTVYTGYSFEYVCVDTPETPGYLTYKALENN